MIICSFYILHLWNDINIRLPPAVFRLHRRDFQAEKIPRPLLSIPALKAFATHCKESFPSQFRLRQNHRNISFAYPALWCFRSAVLVNCSWKNKFPLTAIYNILCREAPQYSLLKQAGHKQALWYFCWQKDTGKAPLMRQLVSRL